LQTIADLRKFGRQVLGDALDADILLMAAAGIGRTALLTQGDEIIRGDAEAEFRRLLDLRAQGMPVQYILGRTEFMSLEFIVNENVLIPRPDTEILVEAVLERESGSRGLEIGTGSGCISIALAHHGRNLQLTAIDICPKAIDIARQNADKHRVGIDFIQMDIFASTPTGDFDFIVSNPPYIPTGDIAGLGANVRDFEPRRALDGGRDGLEFYRKIAKICNGRIYLEIGYNQGEDVCNILEDNRFANIDIIKDYAGHNRVVIGKKES